MIRRELLKAMALASAATAASTLVPGVAFADLPEETNTDVQWKKTPCRFCGVGCGLLVGVQKGRAVVGLQDPGFVEAIMRVGSGLRKNLRRAVV